MSKKKNYESGKTAEEFYRQIIAPADFNKPLNDERENHIEGDFSIGTVRKYIIEVKGDHVCFRGRNPTGNLPIEIKNTANANGEGWFTHCGMDGMNVWRYCLDEEGRRVLEEWRTIKARQAAARKEAKA